MGPKLNSALEKKFIVRQNLMWLPNSFAAAFLCSSYHFIAVRNVVGDYVLAACGTGEVNDKEI